MVYTLQVMPFQRPDIIISENALDARSRFVSPFLARLYLHCSIPSRGCMYKVLMHDHLGRLPSFVTSYLPGSMVGWMSVDGYG